MASWETLAAFAAALAVFAYMPGPATLYAAAQTMARGRRAGLVAAAGLHLGGYVHVVATALGLSAALAYVPGAYFAIKFAGALYLIWLGVNVIRSKADDGPHQPPVRDRGARSTLVQSIVVEILNPKAALFFLAFLPQFVDPGAAWPVPVQLLTLGFVTLLAFTSADLVTVALASVIVARARNAAILRRFFQWIGGTILMGLGVRLALESER